jgi:Zn finger protein HypA/HybF involved in hydrogenase expression
MSIFDRPAKDIEWINKATPAEDGLYLCQCYSCEQIFKSDGSTEYCPYCGSGNWIFGSIDELKGGNTIDE